MTQNEIHILRLTAQKGRLYYYQGNFFHPIDLVGSSPGLVRRGIRDFMKANAALVKSDRADPAYKSFPQLFDEQMKQFAELI
jgi:hypothetical protein